jgi:hypothetical protein
MNEETKKLVREASRYAGLCEAINELMTDGVNPDGSERVALCTIDEPVLTILEDIDFDGLALTLRELRAAIYRLSA